MFYVYVLYSPSYSKIYIGFTSNLEQRFLAHNSLSKKGWTVKFRPWVLVHSQQYATKIEAMQNEKVLKSAKGREWIWQMINNKIEDGLISA